MNFISLKPYVQQKSQCPQCGEFEVISNAYFFQGIHVLRDLSCGHCGLEFWETLPIGHTIDSQVVVKKESFEIIGDVGVKEWLVAPLIQGLKSPENKAIKVQVEKKSEAKKIILLNCLDDCFGHVFTKLWNACFDVAGYGVVVIIPSQCAWLVPENVSEIWTVPIAVSQIRKGVSGLHRELSKLFLEYEEVLIHPAFMHLNHLEVPMEKLLKSQSFPLGQFLEMKPKIGFVLREDRFWLNSPFLEFLFLFAKKFKLLNQFKPVFLWRQKQLVMRCSKLLKKSIPEVEIYVSGLGKTRRFPKYIDDQRIEEIISENEKERNRVYSETHLIIGVHGSHLLIPSGLAAGYININPRYKTAHWIEDTILPYKDRMQHFLGRKLDQNSSPSLVAHHADRIFKDFEYVWKRLKESQF
ncbi:hypothetical protein A33Q_2953 [Indibacter alkaliphilus LW1]|uniref:Uncharacterized protein n=1 Tax=Indibacter alkaliphilus (strain CCUG 57479 / KCTC 22604 / LW1) TaxID=1189612 RepID=S2DU59_INDAL|nr:hypothetical protein [Indibacter alkaliphilus]EOZ95591.1 hypothetical protein A33Q_2953 [Indibacter alkaliphilus LW1]